MPLAHLILDPGSIPFKSLAIRYGDAVAIRCGDTEHHWLPPCCHMQVFSGHSGPVTAGVFTPDGKSIVSVGGEEDSSLRVWSPKTGECTLCIQGPTFHEARE